MSTQINVIDALREAEAGLETAISRLTQRVADYPVASTSEYQALEFVRKALHGAQQGVQTPFMYAIADGYGQPFFEEQGCVSSEAKDLQPEVDSLNENLDGEPPYKVVALYTHPAPKGLGAQDMYYLQDARWSAMVGNCPSFWREGGNGYTTNIDEAGRFTFEEAMAQHRCRETDLPWLCAEVDKLRRPTIDYQYLPRSWDEQRAALAAQAKQGERP